MKSKKYLKKVSKKIANNEEIMNLDEEFSKHQLGFSGVNATTCL